MCIRDRHNYVGTQEALELMEYVDYAMPLRIMDCDVLSYICLLYTSRCV